MGREPHQGSTILLVDDDDEIRVGIKGALERTGYRVKAAYDEQDAIERAQSVNPDLIRLELGWMPPLRALNIGCRIRADAKLSKDVTVVVYANRAD